MRKRILFCRGRPHGRDTRLSWSGTCRNPCRPRNSQLTQLRALPDYERRSKILGNHIQHFLLDQDTKSRISLCIYQDDRILRLDYELCHNYHRVGNSDYLHCLSYGSWHHVFEPDHSCCSFPEHADTFPTGMFLKASSDLYWNHGKTDIASNCDFTDLMYRGLFWTSKGPRTWCTDSGWYFVYRTSWCAVRWHSFVVLKSEMKAWTRQRSLHLVAWKRCSWAVAFESGTVENTMITLQPSG